MDALKEILGLDLPTSTRGMTLASLGMLALALIAIPLVWFFGGTDKFMGVYIGGSVLCVMAFFAGGAIYINSNQASQLREMLAGDFLAHWNYTNEEVQQFSQHETVRTHKDMRFSFFFAIVFGLVVGALTGLLARSLIVMLLAGGFAFLLGVSLVLRDSGRGKADVYPGLGVCEVYIGQLGVYQPGKFCSFADLADAKLESDNLPQTILFYVTSSSSAPMRVGVPYGRETEAKQLVERFKTRRSSKAAS